jgi:HD-GYP domain-containing protein (c-di-GMP phosphodiesterase class II)
MGQEMEQALRTCLLAMRLGAELGISSGDLADLYHVALLRFLGCTADAYEMARIVGGDDLTFRAGVAPALGGSPLEFMSRAVAAVRRGHGPIDQARAVASFLGGVGTVRGGVAAHCELAENLATRIGLGLGVRRGLAAALERWDGGGLPLGLHGEAIPLTARVAYFARDLDVLQREIDSDDLLHELRARSSHAYDPTVVAAFERLGPSLLEEINGLSAWAAVLAAEPEPREIVPPDRLDRVLEAFADFADLKSPYTLGHSRGVADLACTASESMHLEDPHGVRRAGLVHDLGRVGVPNGIWDKRGPLSETDRERVRLHPYYTERILARTPSLASLMPAGAHHERLDGSGYHRGSRGDIGVHGSVLAAADAYQAMTQSRPHRRALDPDEAARQLTADAAAGRLDPVAVQAILAVARGKPVPIRHAWPAGLSDREVEVLRLICRGATKKDVAAALTISPSTADHHVRHIYEKIGVSTRAGAAVFALQHDLLQK